MIRFPDLEKLPAAESVVYIGGDLSLDNLAAAYRRGIFPWPSPGLPMLWHCPNPRGVLDFKDFHVPRSVRRARKKACWRFSVDTVFEDVIQACAAAPRGERQDSWITPGMIEAYIRFHSAGFAHSFECWLEDKLVGGLYGVCVDGVFSGESMFHIETGASKLCLVEAVCQLRRRDLTWMDVQMVTPVVELFGGKYISRSKFLDRLKTRRRGEGAPKTGF